MSATWFCGERRVRVYVVVVACVWCACVCIPYASATYQFLTYFPKLDGLLVQPNGQYHVVVPMIGK